MVNCFSSHIPFHVLVTEEVYSAAGDGVAVYHPALDLATTDFRAVQGKIRKRGFGGLEKIPAVIMGCQM